MWNCQRTSPCQGNQQLDRLPDDERPSPSTRKVTRSPERPRPVWPPRPNSKSYNLSLSCSLRLRGGEGWEGGPRSYRLRPTRKVTRSPERPRPVWPPRPNSKSYNVSMRDSELGERCFPKSNLNPKSYSANPADSGANSKSCALSAAPALNLARKRSLAPECRRAPRGAVQACGPVFGQPCRLTISLIQIGAKGEVHPLEQG